MIIVSTSRSENTEAAPLFAASMIPRPPPVQTTMDCGYSHPEGRGVLKEEGCEIGNICNMLKHNIINIIFEGAYTSSHPPTPIQHNRSSAITQPLLVIAFHDAHGLAPPWPPHGRSGAPHHRLPGASRRRAGAVLPEERRRRGEGGLGGVGGSDKTKKTSWHPDAKPQSSVGAGNITERVY